MMEEVDNYIITLVDHGVDLEELLMEATKNCKYDVKYDDGLRSDPIDQLIYWFETDKGHAYWFEIDSVYHLPKYNLCTVGEFLERLEYHIEPLVVKLIKGL